METKLYVGNLSYETTEDELRNLFAQAGVVNEVVLIKDRDTGSSKGFAFVTMGTQEDAKKAIQQFSGQSLGNRELKVNMALPREERPRSNYDNNRPGGFSNNSRNRGGGRGY
jgi:RNA recognition motif-containing protein